MQTWSELLRSQARHFANKTFLVYGDKSWTYAAYLDHAEKLARVMLDHGETKGQPVCLYLPSRPELAVAYYACQLIGAIATPMSAIYRSAEITKIMTRTGARVVITDTERASHIRAAKTSPPTRRRVAWCSRMPCPSAPRARS